MLKKNYRLLSFFTTLIVFTSLLAGYIAPPVNAQSTPAQERRTGSPLVLEIAQDAQATQIINDSVLTVNGMQFPKVAPAPNANAKMAEGALNPSCCKPGDTRTVDVAGIELWTPVNTRAKIFNPPGGPEERIYASLSSCWVISTYSRVVTGSNPPFSASDDAQPANFAYVASSQYESVQNDLKNYVLNLKIDSKSKADLNVKLEEFVRSYRNYASSISTSHGQVRHYAQVQGRGWFNGKSHYKGHLRVTEICCPPEVRDAAQLKATLNAWVDETVSKLPRKVSGPPRGDFIYRESTLSPRGQIFISPDVTPTPSPTPKPQ